MHICAFSSVADMVALDEMTASSFQHPGTWCFFCAQVCMITFSGLSYSPELLVFPITESREISAQIPWHNLFVYIICTLPLECNPCIRCHFAPPGFLCCLSRKLVHISPPLRCSARNIFQRSVFTRVVLLGWKTNLLAFQTCKTVFIYVLSSHIAGGNGLPPVQIQNQDEAPKGNAGLVRGTFPGIAAILGRMGGHSWAGWAEQGWDWWSSLPIGGSPGLPRGDKHPLFSRYFYRLPGYCWMQQQPFGYHSTKAAQDCTYLLT